MLLLPNRTRAWQALGVVLILAAPRVSVVVAAYNAAGFIGEAIASVQAQTEPAWEILVVDDCSTDETRVIVEDLASRDNRIHLLRAAINGGPGAARNIGFAAARGDWVAVLDADDRYEPDRLRQLLALGVRFGVEIVTDNLLNHGEGHVGAPKAMLPSSVVAEPRLMSAREYILGNIGRRGRARFSYGFLKFMVRRDFLVQHGITYSHARFSEDYLFALDCLLHGARMAITPNPLYLYTIRSGSLTASFMHADMIFLIANYRQMMATAAAARHPELRDAMARHLASTENAFAWIIFADALKKRDTRAAIRIATRDRRTVIHVARQVTSALPRFVSKSARRLARKAGSILAGNDG